MVILIALIACVSFFSIIKLKGKPLSIAVTTIACVLLMFPFTSLLNHYIDINAKEKKPASEQLEREIANLNKELEAYKHAQLNLQSFSEIAELALFETQLDMTEYKNKTFEDKQDEGYIFGWGKNENKSYGKEYLGVYTYKLNPKFGIDLKEVKVKEDGDKIIVGVIKNKYIGTPQFQQETKLSEIRAFEKEKIEKDKYIANYKVLSDKKSLEHSHQLADQYRNEFQNRLSKGIETKFIDNAVINLSKNFITLILNPKFDKNHIEFTDTELEDGVPIMEYLSNKIKEKEKQISEQKGN